MSTQTSPVQASKRKLYLILGGVLAGLCVIGLIVGAIGNSLKAASHQPTPHVQAISTSAVQTVYANVTLDVAIKDNHGTETAMAHSLQTIVAKPTIGAINTSAVQTVFANVTLDVAIKDNHGTETAMAHTLQTSLARQTVFANVTLDVAIKNNHGTETAIAASRALQTSVATPTKTP